MAYTKQEIIRDLSLMSANIREGNQVESSKAVIAALLKKMEELNAK